MSQSKASTPDSGALPPSQTVTLDTPEPLIATSLVRGYPACETPLYDPRDAPAHWRKTARWVPWTKVPRTTYGRLRRVQRVLIKPTGAISHNAAPSIWRSFDGAAEIARQLGFNAQDGGLAYVLPPLSDTAPPSALFFTLPSFTIAPGPIAAALGGAVRTPPGPFTAAALASGYLPGEITSAAQALPPGFEPAEVTATAHTPPPGWEPAEVTVYPSTPAERDALTQSNGWTYAYVPVVKKWCWLKVAPSGRRP
jgi:hypothetical protein